MCRGNGPRNGKKNKVQSTAGQLHTHCVHQKVILSWRLTAQNLRAFLVPHMAACGPVLPSPAVEKRDVLRSLNPLLPQGDPPPSFSNLSKSQSQGRSLSVVTLRQLPAGTSLSPSWSLLSTVPLRLLGIQRKMLRLLALAWIFAITRKMALAGASEPGEEEACLFQCCLAL